VCVCLLFQGSKQQKILLTMNLEQFYCLRKNGTSPFSCCNLQNVEPSCICTRTSLKTIFLQSTYVKNQEKPSPEGGKKRSAFLSALRYQPLFSLFRHGRRDEIAIPSSHGGARLHFLSPPFPLLHISRKGQSSSLVRRPLASEFHFCCIGIILDSIRLYFLACCCWIRI
jgi:hypothetical protein